MKRFLSVLFVILICTLTVLPLPAGAAETASVQTGASSGTTGDCTWKLSNGVLTVSGNGAMADYSYTQGNLAPWGTGVKSAVISDGVTSIGKYAFFKCTSLKSVSIADSVTTIGANAFNTCSGLTDINLPYGITVIGGYTFGKCSSLKDITIPNSVKNIEYFAFSGCTGLTGAVIPDGVTSIGEGAFTSCSNLTSINVPDSVTSIGELAFSNTAWYDNQPDGLVYAGKVAYKYKGTMPENTSIVLENGTKGIAGEAFFNCAGLTGIVMPESVTSMLLRVL